MTSDSPDNPPDADGLNAQQSDAEQLDGFGFDLEEDEWMGRVSDSLRSGPLGAIGPYKILGEIARGGQGVVFRAEQPGTGRIIALKRLVAGKFASDRGRQRFEREMEITARLQHPGIVTLLGVENVDGQPVLAMDWIEGVTPVRWARPEKGAARSTREIVQLVIEIADAVHYAHQRGVIHRDLKPPNILVDGSDKPHVLDFGIAKLQQEDESGLFGITRTDEFVGSPTFAPPEQMRHGASATDMRGDVYSLGMVLYQMLCGRLPYDFGAGFAEILQTLEEQQPKTPSSLVPGLSYEIDTIVLTAIAKDPDVRYSSVDAFRADLHNWLEGRPINAHPPSTWYMVRKLVARNRLAFTFSVTVIALVFGFGIYTQLQSAKLIKQTLQTQEARADADSSDQRAEQVQGFALQDILLAMNPSARGHSPQLGEVLADASQTMASRFSTDPIVEAQMRTAVGEIQVGLGDFSAAVENLERALQLLKESSDPLPERIAGVKVDLAAVLICQSEYAKSEAILDDLGSVEFEQNRRDSLFISLLLTRDRLEEALTHSESLVERQSNNPDLDPRELWFSRLQRASIQRRAGHFDVAILEFDALLMEAVDRFGNSHVDVATAHRELGICLIGSGDFTKGEKDIRVGMEMRRELLGETHPDYAQSLVDLGSFMLESPNRTEEGVPLLQEAAKIFRDAGAGNHESVAMVWNALASVAAWKGDFEEAEKLFGESLTLLRSLLGPAHPTVADALANMGMCISRKGMVSGDEECFSRADALFQEAYSISLAVLGPDHRNLAHALNGRAVNARISGDNKLAAECYSKTLQLLQKLHPAGHPLIVLVLNNIGKLKNELGETVQTLEVFRESYSIAQACDLPPGQMDRLEAMRNLARAERLYGELEIAIALYQELCDNKEAWKIPAEQAAVDKAELDRCLSKSGSAE